MNTSADIGDSMLKAVKALIATISTRVSMTIIIVTGESFIDILCMIVEDTCVYSSNDTGTLPKQCTDRDHGKAVVTPQVLL